MNISVGMTIPGIRSPLLDAHLPWRCQGQIVAGFVIDFYCHKAGLVVEADGDDGGEEHKDGHEVILPVGGTSNILWASNGR